MYRFGTEKKDAFVPLLWSALPLVCICLFLISPPPPPACRCTPQRAQVGAGVGKPPHGLGVCIWMHLVNGMGKTPSLGQRTCGVVKQDKSSGGSGDTTKTRSGPQRVRISSGERPIGAAKGKQPDAKALCQPPPPPRRRPVLPCCAKRTLHPSHPQNTLAHPLHPQRLRYSSAQTSQNGYNDMKAAVEQEVRARRKLETECQQLKARVHSLTQSLEEAPGRLTSPARPKRDAVPHYMLPKHCDHMEDGVCARCLRHGVFAPAAATCPRASPDPDGSTTGTAPSERSVSPGGAVRRPWR